MWKTCLAIQACSHTHRGSQKAETADIGGANPQTLPSTTEAMYVFWCPFWEFEWPVRQKALLFFSAKVMEKLSKASPALTMPFKGIKNNFWFGGKTRSDFFGIRRHSEPCRGHERMCTASLGPRRASDSKRSQDPLASHQHPWIIETAHTGSTDMGPSCTMNTIVVLMYWPSRVKEAASQKCLGTKRIGSLPSKINVQWWCKSNVLRRHSFPYPVTWVGAKCIMKKAV